MIAELVLRVFIPETRFLYSSTDLYWKARFHEQSSELTRNNIKSKDAVYDPELGWRMKPFYERKEVNHNSHGFRGKLEFTLNPQSSRIFAVGDSFTYGLGVKDEETFSAYLSQISRMEVINAGVNAYGVDQALLTWEKKGKLFQPKTVVLGYYVDDFFRNALTIRDRPKPYFFYDKIEQEFRLNGIPVPELQLLESEEITVLKRRLRVIEALSWMQRKVQQKLGYIDDDALHQRARLSNYILNRFNDSVAQAGARFLVVIIGHCSDGKPEYVWIENSIAETCHKNNIKCINLAAAMRKQDFKSFYLPNCHWSKKGHFFAANKIADALDLK